MYTFTSQLGRAITGRPESIIANFSCRSGQPLEISSSTVIGWVLMKRQLSMPCLERRYVVSGSKINCDFSSHAWDHEPVLCSANSARRKFDKCQVHLPGSVDPDLAPCRHGRLDKSIRQRREGWACNRDCHTCAEHETCFNRGSPGETGRSEESSANAQPCSIPGFVWEQRADVGSARARNKKALVGSWLMTLLRTVANTDRQRKEA
jgi:hypothetical protein